MSAYILRITKSLSLSKVLHFIIELTKHIKANPKICLAFVEQPRGDKATLVTGQARIIEDMDEKRRVWGIAGFDLSDYFSEGPEDKEYCLLNIVPAKIEWRDSWTGETNIYGPV